MNTKLTLKIIRITHFIPIVLMFLFVSCNNESQLESKTGIIESFQNRGHELIYNMVQKVGDYNELKNKKDVSYTYTYTTPDGKQDISTEKYIFDGELSYGLYKKHTRTMPELTGDLEQGYDGANYWLKHNGEIINDPKLLKSVAFNRPTNFYWFAMMQKLLDPGLSYNHLGEKEVNGSTYDVVKIEFTSDDDKPKDIYQVYLNQKTSLVDQFLFTVADFGVIENPLLMQVKYETVDGILVPFDRKYKSSTWDADVSEDPWITVMWSDIAFNTNLKKDTFIQ